MRGIKTPQQDFRLKMPGGGGGGGLCARGGVFAGHYGIYNDIAMVNTQWLSQGLKISLQSLTQVKRQNLKLYKCC